MTFGHVPFDQILASVEAIKREREAERQKNKIDKFNIFKAEAMKDDDQFDKRRKQK